MNKKIINILLCIDDFKWDYTRHCAVTILSLLETNKNQKIKIFIMSSCLPEENMEELKRIIALYNQEIEFIIQDNIIPGDIKNSVINRRNLTWGTRYRLFFPNFIKGIDRLLYIDCDVLVTKDISKIYNMDMKWKAIAWWHDVPIREYLKKRYFWINNYINAWVLLFDAKEYAVNKINASTVNKLNDLYWKYINDSDQDYLNLIFRDDIIIYDETMNYIIENKFFNKWLKNASILHCLQKPYKKWDDVPKSIRNTYFSYLKKTKWDSYWLEWDRESATKKLYLFITFFVKRFMWKKAQIYCQIMISKIKNLIEKVLKFDLKI